MGAETRLSLLNRWLFNAGFVDPANGRVRNPFGFLRAEEITDSQLLEELLILSEDFDDETNLEIYRPEPEEIAQRLLQPEHRIYLGPPGSGRTTLARYADHQLGSQSLGIYNDIDSAAEAAYEHLQSEKTGVFYLILDQQPVYSFDELADLLTGLQEMSAPESRVWIKFFLPRTCSPTDIVQRLPKIEQLFAQELSWNAKRLRGILLQRMTWAFGWRRNLGLNEFSTEELISHVGGDVDLALAQQVNTPRALLTSAREMIIHALLGQTDLPFVPLTYSAWQSFTASISSPDGTTIFSIAPLPSLEVSPIISGGKSSIAYDLGVTPSSTTIAPEIYREEAPSTPSPHPTTISGSQELRHKLAVSITLSSDCTRVIISYDTDPRKRKYDPVEAVLPYTKKHSKFKPPVNIIRKALDQNCQDEGDFPPTEWNYLKRQRLIEPHSSRVREAIPHIVGGKLLEVLSKSREFNRDLLTTNSAADIQLSLRAADSLLASFPWELISDREESLLLTGVGLTRHLLVENESGARQPPLRVLYVAPRPVLSQDTWPGYGQANATAGSDNDDHRIKPNAAIRRILVDPDPASIRTMRELQRRLDEDPSISVIHFDGHIAHARLCITCDRWESLENTLCTKCGGRLGGGKTQTIVAFERNDTDRTVAPVKISKLKDMTSRWANLALVVLYACNSAIPADINDGMTGAAQKLLLAGTRCVVGMQAPVYDVPVIRERFTETLYEQLSATGSIATAMRAVRRELEDTGAWWMPVVYLRADDDPNSPLFETAAGRADGQT